MKTVTICFCFALLAQFLLIKAVPLNLLDRLPRDADNAKSYSHAGQELAKDKLMREAKKYIKPEILAGIDLNDENQLKELEALLNAKRAERAQYNFAYSVKDEISDSYVERSEQRDGTSLQGTYSYSDGYFKHTVSYIADENGYRVTDMDSVPIGNGPQKSKVGRAVVHSLVSGVETQYAIQAQPMEEDENVEGKSVPTKIIDITDSLQESEGGDEETFSAA